MLWQIGNNRCTLDRYANPPCRASIRHPSSPIHTSHAGPSYTRAIYRYTIAMTHVSKTKVKPRVSLRIKRNLITAATERKGIILESLLTPTETLMLAKRLAMIVMIERGESTYRISKLLKVSVSSVGRFKHMIHAGLFKPIIRGARKRNRTLLDILELVLAAGMPSIAGPGHSRRLQRLRKGC